MAVNRQILLINPNTTAAITGLVTDHARRIAGDAATFVPVTGRFGAHYLSSRAAAAIGAHAALDAFAEYGRDCDAVYLACFGDPGLAALKEVSHVPVVGMAEAACKLAARDGKQFSIVTGGALWKPMMEEFVDWLGLRSQLASVRTVAPTGDMIARDPQAAHGLLTEACMKCATEDDAEIVILGGAALAGIAGTIQPRVSFPLICSVEAGTRAVLAALKPDAQTRPALESIGLSPSLATLLSQT